MTLRIAGGRLRGRRLRPAPRSRPTQERVREALFSRWGERVVGARMLDLFAGSGAVGLEALSRGASWCGFVEKDRRALSVLDENCRELDLDEETVVFRGDLPAVLGSPPADWPLPIGLIFADPPYDFGAYRILIERALPLLGPDGELVVEHSDRVALELPTGFETTDRRRYGETALTTIGAQPTPRKNEISSR